MRICPRLPDIQIEICEISNARCLLARADMLWPIERRCVRSRHHTPKNPLRGLPLMICSSRFPSGMSHQERTSCNSRGYTTADTKHTYRNERESCPSTRVTGKDGKKQRWGGHRRWRLSITARRFARRRSHSLHASALYGNIVAASVPPPFRRSLLTPHNTTDGLYAGMLQ